MVIDSDVVFSSVLVAVAKLDLGSMPINEGLMAVISSTCTGAIAAKGSCNDNAIVSLLLETRLDLSMVPQTNHSSRKRKLHPY